MPFRADAVENNRDGSFYWQDMEGPGGPGDMPSDFFGQFVDFDGEAAAAADGFHGVATSIAGPPDALFLMDDQQHRVSESTASSGVSTSDEFDFLPNSSQIGPPASAAGHEIDPRELALGREPHALSQQLEYPGRASVSETDLSRLEGISIHSPQKNGTSTSDPSSPTPPCTAARSKSNKFVEALSSTIRKATTMRKSRKPLPEQRAGSPTLDEQQPRALKPPKQRRGRPRIVTHGNVPQSPPVQQQQQDAAGHPHFIHSFCDDPFNEGQLHPPPPLSASSVPYYGQAGIDTPIESPGVKSEPGQFPSGISSAAGLSPWQHQQQQQQQQAQHPHPHPHPHPHQHQQQPPEQEQALLAARWASAGGEYVTSQEQSWWDLGMFPQGSGGGGGGGGGGGEFANHHRSVNLASHAQHSGLPYEYAPMPDTSAAGLMIHMPQPRPSQPTVVNDLTVNAQTYLPPPPPPPAAPPKGSTSERPHRPPRAKSSGARHMSCSPVRKQRGPSASPNPGQQPAQPRSRHSSGASVSVRKRRSRDVSSGGGSLSGESGGGGGGLGGGLGGGFVNFTPNDGSLLMTGVAPSGSSKTKARREKEAQERRRRLSEAALKAVAAAGGDVDKLLEQGFAF
ncbi:developmental regulatory protein wetA [Hirsutella rhossiliensis]|uniref:Developmental regulatory protein wetA n=1 Tax=Hirsutella rhossiliensis TaxID=111463 RepID=A0A9P8SHU3_9HYPO|nr:developmental regulatory protein wetA [Hirsutella rhossiliensis]KAH0961925.1 developmental regulatory protein wetA [Hirsutella rhossiliensis]